MPCSCLFLITALIAAVPVSGRNINTFAGPYIASVKVFYNCGEANNLTYTWHMRTTHFSAAKPYVRQNLTGTMTIGDVFDDSMWLNIFLDTRSNNQWKENAFVFKFPTRACSAIRTNVPDLFRVVFKGSRSAKECRVPAGEYSADGEPVSWVFPNVPIVPYGEYRFRLETGQKGEKSTQACLAADTLVVPKP